MTISNADIIIAAVAIGRNEGERLKKCLESLKHDVDHIVYVDSGSTDNSVNMAKAIGVHVIELDLNTPFTAARARNTGLWFLLEKYPNLEFVQFVDGDCEIQPEWIKTASEFLNNSQEYAVVCGRRRERYPEATIYNQLCDIEWNTPIGEAIACGGDALFRVEALKAVEGYNAALIAGEEPEMCFRMRQQGWKVMRINTEMTLHDAAMTRFSQWWKRNERAGHAYAESYALHGQEVGGFRKKETRSIVIWGALLPLILLAVSLAHSIFMLAWLIYPLQLVRLGLRYRKAGYSERLATMYAMSNLLGKFPQMFGVVTFVKNHACGKGSALIEYK